MIGTSRVWPWLVTGALLGMVLGVVGARLLFVGSALSLIPWGAASVLIGAFARTLRLAVATAAVFGFALATAFMVAGYEGTAPVVTRLLPFAVLGLIGGVCATVLAVGGHAIVQGVRRTRRGRESRHADSRR